MDGRSQPPCATTGTDAGGDVALITPAELEVDLAALEVVGMGWITLSTGEGEQGYLHIGKPLVLCPRQLTVNHQEQVVIEVVGLPDTSMAGMNVLWVG